MENHLPRKTDTTSKPSQKKKFDYKKYRRAFAKKVANAVRNADIGEYVHIESDLPHVIPSLTALPVWKDGRYYITYYLRYGTEKPLDKITARDVLYIDKRIPRNVHWALVNTFHRAIHSQEKKRLTRIAYLSTSLMHKDVILHFRERAAKKLPLINIVTMHAILAYYTSLRNRLSSSQENFKTEKYQLNPYKYLTNKLSISPRVAKRLLNEPFSFSSDGNIPLIHEVFRVAQSLDLRPDALTAYPVLLLVHPTSRNVTIVLPHRTFYPVSMERAILALSRGLNERASQQVVDALMLIADYGKKLIAGEDRLARRDTDYRYFRTAMLATMDSLEERYLMLRGRMRRIRGRRAIREFMRVVRPTGEMHESIRRAILRDKEMKQECKRMGLTRRGSQSIRFTSVYDLDV